MRKEAGRDSRATISLRAMAALRCLQGKLRKALSPVEYRHSLWEAFGDHDISVNRSVATWRKKLDTTMGLCGFLLLPQQKAGQQMGLGVYFVVSLSPRLPRDVGEAPSLEVFQVRLDIGAVNNLL